MASSPPNDRDRTDRRRRALRLGARLGIAAVLVLGVLELAARSWSARAAGPSTNPRYVTHDDVLGWRYVPDVAVRHATDEFDVAVRIGAHGFREQASLPSRAPDVLVFGDSFGFGWGVEAHETFSAGLERELGVAVWNLSVSGYSVDQELLLFRERGRFLPRDVTRAPKLVLVLSCGNDLLEALTERSYGKGKPRFVLTHGELELTNVPVSESWLERHSRLWRSLAKLVYERRRLEPTTAENEAGRDLVARILATFARESREVGARFVVVTTEDRWLGARLDGLGVEHFDLESELAAAAASGAAIGFPRDGHWTAAGHALVARRIAEELTARGLLVPPTPDSDD
ncbi:MAG: SGNH/GDSL hydrolase family protein [Planctomycetes bacterium]|nr:SGNH/GDSL hydrolase family protein [Planctomycetota bacterium]